MSIWTIFYIHISALIYVHTDHYKMAAFFNNARIAENFGIVSAMRAPESIENETDRLMRLLREIKAGFIGLPFYAAIVPVLRLSSPGQGREQKGQ